MIIICWYKSSVQNASYELGMVLLSLWGWSWRNKKSGKIQNYSELGFTLPPWIIQNFLNFRTFWFSKYFTFVNVSKFWSYCQAQSQPQLQLDWVGLILTGEPTTTTPGIVPRKGSTGLKFGMRASFSQTRINMMWKLVVNPISMSGCGGATQLK